MATYKTKKIPVAVILGHIDHGKSSLLEAIKRDFKIIEKESGGITQHIGAYETEIEGKKITFIDTPGHEAFSEMRSRGAKVADIAILVVAVDEGVKPQTKEAIEIINKAKTPMIVALNKIDKPQADPQKVKGGLQKAGVLIEEWGGDVPLVEVSAKTGQGVEDLLSVVNLVSEISDLKVSFSAKPEGVVIESYLDPLSGPTATLILEKGMLKKGNIIGTATTFGKIKKLLNFNLLEKDKILPGQAAVVIGFQEPPEVGEVFHSFDSLDEAREYTSFSKEKLKEIGKKKRVEKKEDIEKFLKVILRADVKGSLEVLQKILEKLQEDKIAILILKSEVGEITDSDVRLAEKEGVQIIGFRVKPTLVARSLSNLKGIEIFTFDVIYDLIESVRKLMQRQKEKKKERMTLGKLKVLVIFKTQKRGEKKYRQIVGARVTEGEVNKAFLEIERGEEILGKGEIIELQEQKRKIEKARVGQEIGILYEGNFKIKEGDTLIVFEIREI